MNLEITILKIFAREGTSLREEERIATWKWKHNIDTNVWIYLCNDGENYRVIVLLFEIVCIRTDCWFKLRNIVSFVDSSVKTRSGVQNRNCPFYVSDVVIAANNDREELRRQSISSNVQK